MTSDIAIAQSAKMLRISQVAQRYDIEEEYLEPYGHYKAKISLDFLDTLKDKPDGKLIIDHDGQEYLLRKTQAGKLLLTK